MSKRIATVVLCLSGAFMWAQSRPVEGQPEKLEIDVMASILETTLRYVGRTDELSNVRIVSRSVRGYYLPNQGIVFEVPTPAFRQNRAKGSAELYQVIARSARDRSEANQQRTLSRDELRRLQEEARQQRSRSSERWADYEKELATMTDFLIEALAEHGDSLASLPDSQFVNLLYRSSTSGYSFATLSGNAPEVWAMDPSNGKSTIRTVSLRKSWINDFKAGRLTLDQVKEKAIYN